MDEFQSNEDWQATRRILSKKTEVRPRSVSVLEGRRDHLTIVTFGRASPQSRYFRAREGKRPRAEVVGNTAKFRSVGPPRFQSGASFCELMHQTYLTVAASHFLHSRCKKYIGSFALAYPSSPASEKGEDGSHKQAELLTKKVEEQTASLHAKGACPFPCRLFLPDPPFLPSFFGPFLSNSAAKTTRGIFGFDLLR